MAGLPDGKDENMIFLLVSRAWNNGRSVLGNYPSDIRINLRRVETCSFLFVHLQVCPGMRKSHRPVLT